MKEKYQIEKTELIRRIKWFIDLRWIAILGVFVVTTLAKYILKLDLHLLSLCIGNTILLLYNGLFLIYYKHIESIKDSMDFKKINRFANIQISLDLVMLSYFIHFGGGIENPFIFYLIFHMVIASILLSNKAAFVQVSFAFVLLGTIILSEYYKILPHYHLYGFINEETAFNLVYISGILSVFASTLYITVYMATSIVNRLREKELELFAVNKILEQQDKLKSQYVLTVSHDLQASLSTIKSCLDVVLNNLAGPISEKSKEMIGRAEQRVSHMINFVKDLLNLSKIRAGQSIEKSIVNLSTIKKNIVDQLMFKIKEKNINLIENRNIKDPSIYANNDAMEQLFSNLLTNAIKYTPSGGKIILSMSNSNNAMNISVEDNGIGIPREDIPNVFKDFYRAKNASIFEKNGTGLGLSIIKQIVDIHNGQINLESEIGKGSKFVVTLPKTNSEARYVG